MILERDLADHTERNPPGVGRMLCCGNESLNARSPNTITKSKDRQEFTRVAREKVEGVDTDCLDLRSDLGRSPADFAAAGMPDVFSDCVLGAGTPGQSEPQLHISKEGDRYLRTLMVQGAHYILGPFGQDSDLRRWGLKLAERGGKNAKKRAVVAVARKLAVLLHKLWVSGEVYEPLRNNHKVVSAVA